jgi:DNA-binding winged helix-turn-helix (wHTH) protein
MDTLNASETLAFDDWCFDRGTHRLSCRTAAGAWMPVSVGSRALDILAVLLERPGTLVSKDTILDAVWPDTAVEINNLAVQISALRRVLDEGRAEGSCIQTVAGRGYRFVVPVHLNAETPGLPRPSPTDHDADNEAPGTGTGGNRDVTAPDAGATTENYRQRHRRIACLLYQNYARYFSKDNAPVLVWQGTTEEMNSSLVGDPLIAEMYAEDPERASAEFGAQFRSDIVAFITREAIEDCLARGIRELPPGGGITYVGHVDPSGGSADSFTLAVAHVESDGLAVLDCIREVKPPFSPDAVVEEFAAVLKSYGIARVTGDAYAGEWPRERFAVHGIAYDVSKKNTSTIYSEFLPALNAGRVRLLDLPRLVGQLVGLERRTRPDRTMTSPTWRVARWSR